MLRCFDHFGQEKNGLMLWQSNTKQIEQHLKNADREHDKAREALTGLQTEVEKKRTEGDKIKKKKEITGDALRKLNKAKEELKKAELSIPTNVESPDAQRLRSQLTEAERRLQLLEDDICTAEKEVPPSGDRTEQAPESQAEPTIEEFSGTFTNRFREKFTDFSSKEAKEFNEDLYPVLVVLDQLKPVLERDVPVQSEIDALVLKFNKERTKFNAVHAEFAIPTFIAPNDTTQLKKEVPIFISTLRFATGTNVSYRSFNPEGMTTPEGEKQLKKDIERLETLDTELFKRVQELMSKGQTQRTSHEVQQITPAYQELHSTLTVKVAAVIGRIENQSDAHPELLVRWKLKIANWEQLTNTNAQDGMVAKNAQRAADAYRSAIHLAFVNGRYELKRSASGQAFTSLEEKRRPAAANAPKIDELKAFFREEGILNDSNQENFTANLKAMPFYTGIFTKPEERTVAEEQAVNQRNEDMKLPTALRFQTKYALDHPGGVILGNPLLFLSLLALIIFDKDNRKKYLGGFAALLGIEAIGGFGALGDMAKSGYDSWLKPLFESLGKPGQDAYNKLIGKSSIESFAEDKWQALKSWSALHTVGEFVGKSADDVSNAFKADLAKIESVTDPAIKAVKNTLGKIVNSDIGKWLGLPVVARALQIGKPEEKMNVAIDRATTLIKNEEAAQAQQKPQNQPGVKPKGTDDSLPEKQAKLQGLALTSPEKFTLDPETKTEASEAVRWIEYTDGAEKRILEIRYDGTFYKAQQKTSREAGAANGSFALWFKGDAIKDGLPAALAGYNFTSSEWRNAKVNAFLKTTREMPAGVTEIADVQPYYSNGRFNVLAKGASGAIVEIGIDANVTDTTEKPFTVTQATDAKGTIASGAKSEGSKTIVETKTFVDGLVATPADTVGSRSFADILPTGKFTDVEYGDDEEWPNAFFTFGGIRYKAFRKGDDESEAFWVESTEKDKSGYALRFANKEMFTTTFEATTTIAHNDGGYTLGALLNGMEGFPCTKATLDLGGDTEGKKADGKFYNLTVETAKGSFKFTAAIGDKEFAVYDLQGNDKVGGKKFTKGTDAGKELGLESGGGGTEVPPPPGPPTAEDIKTNVYSNFDEEFTKHARNILMAAKPEKVYPVEAKDNTSNNFSVKFSKGGNDFVLQVLHYKSEQQKIRLWNGKYKVAGRDKAVFEQVGTANTDSSTLLPSITEAINLSTDPTPLLQQLGTPEETNVTGTIFNLGKTGPYQYRLRLTPSREWDVSIHYVGLGQPTWEKLDSRDFSSPADDKQEFLLKIQKYRPFPK